MRKITFLVLFGLMSLGVNAQCNPCVAKTFNFNTDGNQEAWDYTPSGGDLINVSGGQLVYTLLGTNITPNIRHANFKSSAHQYFHIVLKNESNANEIRFNYKDPANPTTTKFVNIAITTGDTEFKIYTIFAGTDPLTWNSDDISANLRFDNAPARTAKISGTITINKIIVNNLSNLIDWTGATNTDWTVGSNWKPAAVPGINSNVNISPATNNPIIATNVIINSLTIESGASLNVNSGNNLTVTGAIANSGTMALASNSNLIQGGITNNNTGNITLNRNSSLLKRLDYTIWSSPVINAGQYLTTFSPLTVATRFYKYDETTNFYNEIADPSATPFARASGYLIRMPDTDTDVNYSTGGSITYPGVFTGIPNNGTITKTVTYVDAAHGYNMIGNPYPSTIDATAFITANSTNIESTLYFWRKTNGASGTAYATYNSLGSVATSSGDGGTGSEAPNGTIQVGQGFFVKAKSTSDVTFTNAMRITNNVNQFFKTKQVAEKNRVWLNLTNTAGVFSQTLVGYVAGAIQGVDGFDGKYINDSPVALTSTINNEEYTIQGRALPFDPSDVVALNFKTDVVGDYTIALDHFDGVFTTGQDVYLLDSKTGIETDLKAGAYSFTAATGTDKARFSLKFQKTLKVDAPEFNENSVTVYKINETLYVNSGVSVINKIKIFDIQGRLIAEQNNVKTSSATIKNLKDTHQVLIVQVTSEYNKVVSKKVVNYK
jgi:hypothetical protein